MAAKRILLALGDELLAAEAIFGEALVQSEAAGGVALALGGRARLLFLLTGDGDGDSVSCTGDPADSAAARKGVEAFEQHEGSVYAALAAMRQAEEEAPQTAPAAQPRAAVPTVDAAPKRHMSTAVKKGAGMMTGGYTFYESEPLTLQKSTFTAWAARVRTVEEQDRLLAALRPLQPHRLTHVSMRAMRVKPEGKNTVREDYHDDGESGMGEKLAFLLRMRGVENAIVVVSRQMQGGHIGGKRFKLAVQAAQDALDCMVRDETATDATAPVAKKKKGKRK